MNTRRLVVLLLAAGAAGVVALMVRGLVSGGSAKQAEAHAVVPQVEMAQILVAAARIDPGKPVVADSVRWQEWPVKAIDASFIRQTPGTNASVIVDGMVARAPMVPGEPVTFAKVIKSQGLGFMAATIAPGMRAVSIPVTVASLAGGFVLPNTRVDIILTVVTNDTPKHGTTRTVLTDVRVLAVDQAFKNEEQKPVSDARTVTLELTPDQARTVATAQALGTMSLTLRSLGDEQTASADPKTSATARNDGARSDSSGDDSAGMVNVIRYGIYRKPSAGGGVQ